jgi:zinc transport system substrate-binding protein
MLYYNSAFSSSLEIAATTKPIRPPIGSVTDGISKLRMLAYTISAYDYSHLMQVIWTSYFTLMITWKRLLKFSLKTIWYLHSYQSQSINLVPARSHSFSRQIIRIQGEKDLHVWLTMSAENAKSTTFCKCNSTRYRQGECLSAQLQCNGSRRKTKPRS